jgi:hypothetical protein
VLFERGRDVRRTLRQGERCFRALRVGPCDALLERADRLEILVQLRPVARTETAIQPLDLAHDRIENAGAPPHLSQALVGAAAVAEQPFEDDARVDFCRERHGRRAPRDGVRVEAVGAAVAGDGRRAFECELERREPRVFAEHARRDLISGRVEPDLEAGGPRPGMHAAQPCRRRAVVVGIAIPKRLGLPVSEAGYDDDLLAERFERAENRRQREAGAVRDRRPLSLNNTVRCVDESDARKWPGGGLRRGRQRWYHGVEQGQGQRRADAAEERAAWQRHLDDHHTSDLRI